MIASYLGITKESLSRIRHQVSEKIKIAALISSFPVGSVIICQQIFLSFIIVFAFLLMHL